MIACRKVPRSNPVLVFDRRNGFGDDLMVFWALAAATKAGLLRTPQRVIFRHRDSRRLLAPIAAQLASIQFLPTSTRSDYVVFVRGNPLTRFFPSNPLHHIPFLIWRARFALPQYKFHHLIGTYGAKSNFSFGNVIVAVTGAGFAWMPPYTEFYDGMQELAVALRMSKRAGLAMSKKLASSWEFVAMRARAALQPLASKSDAAGAFLLFPAAGSFQDLNDEFIAFIGKHLDVRVARYAGDRRPATYRYSSMAEAAGLMLDARGVITTDSASSHLAQFLARRHVLIASRSRPGNVVFPGAGATFVLDLGKDLNCRPCNYQSLTRASACPRGFPRCEPLCDTTSSAASARLSQALNWLLKG